MVMPPLFSSALFLSSSLETIASLFLYRISGLLHGHPFIIMLYWGYSAAAVIMKGE
jgi:hypothetical protein